MKKSYIWSNTGQNSPQSVRPNCIACKQETDPELTKIVDYDSDNAKKLIYKNGFDVKVVLNNKEIVVK